VTYPVSAGRPVDHVVIAVRDLSLAGATWSALGFQVSPIMQHLALGSSNRVVGFGSTYVELLGSVENMISPHREGWLERFAYGEGLASVAFRSQDLVADHAKLIESGVAMTAIASARRAVTMPDGAAAETDSDFAYLETASPFPTAFLVSHKAPETIFIPAFAIHANTALDIVRITFLSANPAGDLEAVAPLSAGVPPIDFVSHDEAVASLGDHAPPLVQGASFGIGLTIAVASLDACRTSFRPGIAFAEADGALLVPASAATGVSLRFIERKSS